MITITAYQTEDGQIFKTKKAATAHEEYLKARGHDSEREAKKRRARTRREKDEVNMTNLRQEVAFRTAKQTELKQTLKATQREFTESPTPTLKTKMTSLRDDLDGNIDGIRQAVRSIKKLKEKYKYDHHFFNK
jgi:hypothetical protein